MDVDGGRQAALEIREARAEDDEARDRFAAAAPRASFFHLSGWGRVIHSVFGHRRCDLLAWRGGEIVGVLPLMSCRGPLGRRKLISMPYAVYGGPAGRDAEVERALIRAAREMAERQRVGRLELRCLKAPEGCDLESSDLYATFVRDLPGDPSEVLPSLPKKARAEARKARDKHGLELVEGGWYLDDLHRLFHQNKRQLGSPGLPMALFRGLAGEFGDRVVLHVVRRGNQPLIAVMSFVFGETLMSYYAGTAENADRQWSASNYMYLALREWAVERGFRRFDFGRSRRDSGACRFKRHQGFEESPLDYRYLLVRDRSLPSFTPSNPRTRRLREIWMRLPPWLTVRLSRRLARYLP